MDLLKSVIGKKKSTDELIHCDFYSFDKSLLIDAKTLFNSLTCVVYFDRNEWILNNAINLNNNLNEIFKCMGKFCTTSCCPVMTSVSYSQIQWIDDKSKKQKYTGPQYIDKSFKTMDKLFENQEIFPISPNVPVNQKLYETTIVRIYNLLWSICNHLLWTHFKSIVEIGLADHLMTTFIHLFILVKENNYIDSKEIAIMTPILNKFIKT